VEKLDRTFLTVSDEEFEKNVEAAVSSIAEGHPPGQDGTGQSALLPVPGAPEASPRSSSEGKPPPLPQRTRSKRNESSKNESDGEEIAAVAGLLRTIQRPLSTIGRIFGDDTSNAASTQMQTPPSSQPPVTPKRLSPLPRGQVDGATGISSQQREHSGQHSAEDAAARQASREAEEARKVRIREERNSVETLCGMFPALDREVVVDVVRANEGR